jgi:dTDP-glucose 4,6-dehydratase
LIPKTIILAKLNKKIPIYGKGTNIRDWIYVDDHCNGVLTAFLKGKSGESYNISKNNEINNLVIVKKILELMNKSEDLIEFVEDRPGHDFRYSMNSEKISKELGWKSKVDFEKGIQDTINWYEDHEDYWKDTPSSVFNPTPWKNLKKT